MDIYTQNAPHADYIVARYYLQSKTTLWDAAYNIAVGQSMGNPKIRNAWETDEMYERNCCKVLSPNGRDFLDNHQSGEVLIAFPKANIDFKEDGISQLLCFLMGGHLDIDIIESCKLLDIEGLPSFFRPKFGLTGLRELTGSSGKPLLGGIIKPKTGIKPEELLSIVTQLVEGGVDFIKEDEILGNPSFCTLTDRLKVVQPYLNHLRGQGRNVVYCYCINADFPYLIDRAIQVAEAGGNGVHLNVWCGLGAYKSVRAMNLPLFLHFQKSGDRAFTNPAHAHHIDWNVVCKLAVAIGVDSIHAGMWGGYSSYGDDELSRTLTTLRAGNVVPALSCGMHPGLVNKVTELFGPDYMANVGGALHGHPGGTLAGVRAMRQAIDGTFGAEYEEAVRVWGLVS